ncbi:MAG: hypothetical protein H6841_10545 [Planctomycetes bacterium]|nr:hypothetical protein [Planctomycetota bacterium]
MFDASKLPAAEQEAIRLQVKALYLEWGGEDIDRAIARDRKVVVEHERELDHVATLPFDKPYRWRIAPSVGLRAQKDLERQQKRRAELLAECIQQVLQDRGHLAESRPAGKAVAPAQPGAIAAEVQQLGAHIVEAIGALKEWKSERAEASPELESAAA